jgi:hypothetical protein
MKKILSTLFFLLMMTSVSFATDICVSAVDGSDSDNGTTWALAKQTVSGALAIAANGDRIYVDKAGNFSSAAAITWDAAAGASVSIISVTRSGAACAGSAWSAGATETVGANTFTFTVQSTGAQSMYIYGMTFVGNSGSSGSNDIRIGGNAGAITTVQCDSCTFTVPGTNTGAQILLGAASSATMIRPVIKLVSPTFNGPIIAGGSILALSNAKIFISGATLGYAGATKPTTGITTSTGSGVEAEIVDSDLSGFNTSSSNFISVASFQGGSILFRNCKLSSTPSLITGTWLGYGASITLINVDTGDTHNVFEYRNALGTITESTSIYANAGGYFDGAGISWQIVTTSLASESNPFITPWLERWSDSTSSMTTSLNIVHDSATNLTNRNLWEEFEYLSNASFPQGTLVNGRNSQPFDGSAVDWPADTSNTWTGTGGFGNPNKQILASTFTPAERSLLRGRLYVASASKTLYLDPVMRMDGGFDNSPTRWIDNGAYVETKYGGATITGACTVTGACTIN